MLRRLLALSLLGCTPVVRAPTPPPAAVHGLANIQRTMRLLSESSAAQPNRVRILFYGQSITQSAWSRKVAADLHAKYPDARVEIQNRALGGFSSERLLETADSDLYPWQPDLVIFHVYGAHDKYAQLIERIRARTSAEVLLQTDHITRDEELSESRDVRANPPDAEHWSGFMNQVFLPSLVEPYQVALCDLRASWKLALQHRPASTLLADAIHLNAEGDRLMAALVESCLVRAPALRSPAEEWVKTLAPASRLELEGTRVDAVVAAGTGFTRVRIDGAPPSSLGLLTFARAHVRGADKWPPLHGIGGQPTVAETFTLAMQRDGARYRFQLRGSISGDVGEGTTDAPFTSQPVVIEPTDWDIDYAFELMGRTAPDVFEIELRVEAHALDGFAARAQEYTVTLAQGLSPGPHLLELEGDAPLRALTVYRSARER